MLEQSNVTDDQPSQESTTQDNQDQVNEQPEATGDQKSENAEKSLEVEIDGEKLTAEQIKEFKLGYMREQDYRKKTQELAEEKRKLGRSNESIRKEEEEMTPEVKAAVEVLKKAGVVTKDDLAMVKAYEEDQKQFRKFIKTNPELKAYEKALQSIGKKDNRAWEDIAIDYGFISKDKLSKAKSSKPIVGVKSVEPVKTKSIKDMSAQEYAEWKKQNLGDGLR